MKILLVAALMVVAVQGFSFGGSGGFLFNGFGGFGNMGKGSLDSVIRPVVDADNMGKAAMIRTFNEGAQVVRQNLGPIESQVDQMTGLPLTQGVHQGVEGAISVPVNIPCPLPIAANAVQGVANGTIDGVAGSEIDLE
ncbi:unnamed protein product [Oppiella nova]|uniref:Uncharacterized protein n=1 Tax=Oppiella nova TaxID=334625 RepID=A0A7R9MFP6_9ACAR|nr:unnamed protein product [Oppiella nova]CAG2176219.1 unnamed protein product [Oppiella nova]